MKQPEHAGFEKSNTDHADKVRLRRWLRPALVLSATLLMAGCVAYDNHPRHRYPQQQYPQQHYPQQSQSQRPPMVPPGHMPPPGLCRIWYPDRPPGHQPAPDRCGKLKYHVPPGAYLVYG